MSDQSVHILVATGTPAGVGFGQDPPTFLKPGDIGMYAYPQKRLITDIL